MSLPGAVVLIIGVALCWMSRVVPVVVAAGGRDFTAQDIVQLYPARQYHLWAMTWPSGIAFTACCRTTPFPGGFKCFTCEDARDNYDCNRWAPDVFCPQGSRYCYTRHLMDGLGASESITKRCVAVRDCVGATGCRTLADAARRTECVSCCEGNICNLPVPRNHSDAVFSTETPVWPSGASPCRSARWPVLCALLGALMLPA